MSIRIRNILALVSVLLLLSASGIAENDASISVRWTPDGTAAEGAAFELYRVAEISADGTYTLTEEFAGFDGELNAVDLRSLAITLAAHAAANGLQAEYTESIGSDGETAFSGLAQGLYLLTGQPHEISGRIYTPQPSLIRLAAGSNVAVKPKYDAEDQKTIQLRVVKRWDDGESEQRPDFITVQLIGNGEVVETVRLHRENGWQHSWEALDAGIQWQAAEKPVPEGYSAHIDRQGDTVVITNSKKAENEPGNRLPQTGSLMWPVPVLAGGGMLLFLLGWIRSRRK